MQDVRPSITEPDAVFFTVISRTVDMLLVNVFELAHSRPRDPFGQHQESRPLASPNTGSPRLTESLFKSDKSDWLKTAERVLCAAILGADQKDRVLWGREWNWRCKRRMSSKLKDVYIFLNM